MKKMETTSGATVKINPNFLEACDNMPLSNYLPMVLIYKPNTFYIVSFMKINKQEFPGGYHIPIGIG